MEGDADLVLGLLLDARPTEGDGVLQPLDRRLLSGGELPLLPPLLLLQLVSFSALVRVPAGDRVLATKKRGRRGQKSRGRRREGKDLWEFYSRLFWCGWRAGLLAGDASCSCHGEPWGGAVGRSWGVQGSSHRCQPCCQCCWGGSNCCVTESPATIKQIKRGKPLKYLCIKEE